MKKILISFEGESFPQELLEFARQLNVKDPILLTAAFVPEVDYAHLWSTTGGVASALFVPQVEDESTVIEDHSVNWRRIAPGMESSCASECPMMLIPEKVSLSEDIILMYDGTAASVHAVKQFAYVFPELVNIFSVMGLSSAISPASEKCRRSMPAFNGLANCTTFLISRS